MHPSNLSIMHAFFRIARERGETLTIGEQSATRGNVTIFRPGWRISYSVNPFAVTARLMRERRAAEVAAVNESSQVVSPTPRASFANQIASLKREIEGGEE